MNKKEYLVFGLVTLVLLSLFIRCRSSTASLPAAAPAHVNAGKGQAVQILPKQPSPVDMRQYQEELNHDRARYAQARALGLKTLEFKGAGDTVSVPIIVAPHKVWCQGGDLDTMRYASKDDTSKEFLITLEGIGAGGKNPSLRTSLKELSKGLTHTFTLPRPREATSYGLYICTDSRGENSCQRKGLVTHAQLSEQLAKSAVQAKAQDHIFFFQNLVIDGKQIEAWRSDDFSSDFQKSISSHLTKRGLSASDVQAAWKANTALKSTPTDIRDGRIVLSLPYNDPRCMSNDSPKSSPASL